MVEHKSHSISMPVDAGDAGAAGGNEIVDRLKQYVGQDGAFQMAPQSFDRIQARAARRKPKHGDLIGVGLQPRPHRLGMVKPSVVAHQTNLAACVGRHEGDEEGDNLRTALLVGHGVGDFAGGEIHAAVHDFLFILARRGDFGLDADRRPHPGQGGAAMDLDFVLKDQRFGGVGLQGFFLSERAVFRPFRRPLRLVLPFRACLGRWNEKPS